MEYSQTGKQKCANSEAKTRQLRKQKIFFYGLVEVKLGGDKLIEEGAGNLLELAGRINTDKMNDPSFMMVLVGVGDYAYRRKDGIYIIYSTYRLFEGLSRASSDGVRLRTLIAGDVGMALARKRQGFLPTI